MAALLQSEWSEMEAKAAELRVQIGSLVTWQTAQAKAAAAALKASDGEALAHMPSTTGQQLAAIGGDEGGGCVLM